MQFCGELVQMYMAAFAPQCILLVVVVVKKAHFNEKITNADATLYLVVDLGIS